MSKVPESYTGHFLAPMLGLAPPTRTKSNVNSRTPRSARPAAKRCEARVTPDPWEQHAGWWQDGFTDGADPEYVEQIVPLCLELLDGRRTVVDIGCGEGQLARMLTGRGADVVGLDPTDAQLRLATPRRRSELRHAAAEGLPLRDATCDATLACLVFEHISDHVPPIHKVACWFHRAAASCGSSTIHCCNVRAVAGSSTTSSTRSTGVSARISSPMW